jgi:hypothetical protein
MSLPPAYLRRKLTQPLPTKSGAVLRTIGEAANYVLALPTDRGELCQRWRHATKLILSQRNGQIFSLVSAWMRKYFRSAALVPPTVPGPHADSYRLLNLAGSAKVVLGWPRSIAR